LELKDGESFRVQVKEGDGEQFWYSLARAFETNRGLPVETAAPLATALARKVYVTSERHLSGYRLILGFETLSDVQAAHTEVTHIGSSEEPSVAPTPEHAKTSTYITIVCDGCGARADLPRAGREGVPHETPTSNERVSDDALRQQLTYWRERRDSMGVQLAALLFELQESRSHKRVVTHALGAIAGGDIYPQKLAREALDLMRQPVETNGRLWTQAEWTLKNKQVDELEIELRRYKKALQTANGFLIMNNLEPVKLEYSSEEPEVRIPGNPDSPATTYGTPLKASAVTEDPPEA
jgi:hypothetical protein